MRSASVLYRVRVRVRASALLSCVASAFDIGLHITLGGLEGLHVRISHTDIRTGGTRLFLSLLHETKLKLTTARH